MNTFRNKVNTYLHNLTFHKLKNHNIFNFYVTQLTRVNYLRSVKKYYDKKVRKKFKFEVKYKNNFDPSRKSSIRKVLTTKVVTLFIHRATNEYSCYTIQLTNSRAYHHDHMIYINICIRKIITDSSKKGKTRKPRKKNYMRM
jgi:hypothetical protein